MQRLTGAEATSRGEAYPTVYYPATIDARHAAVVMVEPGAELHGIDLQLVRAHGVRVSGRITTPPGSSPAPLFQMVTLVPAGQRDAPGQVQNLPIRDSKGEFEFLDVMPGKYRLQVGAGGFDETNQMSARRTLEVGYLVAPDAPKQRQAALFAGCRTQADGTCKILGIAPGEYHVYAFPAGTEVDRRDPDAMKPFEKYGEAIKFGEGERKLVNLKTAQIE